VCHQVQPRYWHVEKANANSKSHLLGVQQLSQPADSRATLIKYVRTGTVCSSRQWSRTWLHSQWCYFEMEGLGIAD
jgi:hypothetical protein